MTHHVLDCATETVGPGSVFQFFRQAEVGDDNVTPSVQKDVFQFDVSVDDL